MFFDYLVLVLVVVGVLVSLLYSLITGISPVSSTFGSRKKIIKSASPDQQGFIYELGAGWGALGVHEDPCTHIRATEFKNCPAQLPER